MSDIATALPNSSQALDGVFANPTSTGAERSTQKALGQAEFFKLLTTQLASQDPLKPMDDTAFIAQMANFSELEMMSKLSTNFEEFTSIQQFQAAQGYIGKHVTLQSEEGEISGLATGIEDDRGDTRIFVDGKGYNIDTVFKVELPEG
ncbi:MAG: flagellar hook assembly protein FlgD [Opitutales bacterium]|mgnify:CR=1 FL=1|jgi:flagellar basal-body rod modification protein FlgD|nr:flagellar hook assembly protein FlgD [Opitutales bacterium]MBT6381287.1 flagellar hook assembly protein FlgD [Opitutales bacterium]MBT7867075.1 flagellar hook assembly protein FlgD [Opitutales bacterium]